MQKDFTLRNVEDVLNILLEPPKEVGSLSSKLKDPLGYHEKHYQTMSKEDIQERDPEFWNILCDEGLEELVASDEQILSTHYPPGVQRDQIHQIHFRAFDRLLKRGAITPSLSDLEFVEAVYTDGTTPTEIFRDFRRVYYRLSESGDMAKVRRPQAPPPPEPWHQLQALYPDSLPSRKYVHRKHPQLYKDLCATGQIERIPLLRQNFGESSLDFYHENHNGEFQEDLVKTNRSLVDRMKKDGVWHHVESRKAMEAVAFEREVERINALVPPKEAWDESGVIVYWTYYEGFSRGQLLKANRKLYDHMRRNEGLEFVMSAADIKNAHKHLEDPKYMSGNRPSAHPLAA